MSEQNRKKLSRAEVYAESVLMAMKENPASCYLFDQLVPQIGNNGLIVYGGPGGGSISLATDYLKRLIEIHRPHCQNGSLHKINVR